MHRGYSRGAITRIFGSKVVKICDAGNMMRHKSAAKATNTGPFNLNAHGLRRKIKFYHIGKPDFQPPEVGLNRREIGLDFRQGEIRGETPRIGAAEVFPLAGRCRTNGRNLGGRDILAFRPNFTLPEIQAVSPAVQTNFWPPEIWLIAALVAGHKGTEKKMLKLALCDEEFPSAQELFDCSCGWWYKFRLE
ncbi:hypothetical protein B0H14DRAFT_2596837 [Mycena olivaceomarginata]|nr:hypothetical protein B0H14DRAFT_2596837 [Mycena olivaceomarginata]